MNRRALRHEVRHLGRSSEGNSYDSLGQRSDHGAEHRVRVSSIGMELRRGIASEVTERGEVLSSIFVAEFDRAGNCLTSMRG